jgi:hypothetical protein
VTPGEIEGLRLVLATYPEEERMIFARAAAEYLRLHDASQRLYDVTADDVRHEADQFDCDVHAGTIAKIVERTARRFLE